MATPTKDDLTRLRQICEERNLPFERWGVYWDKTQESSIAFYNKQAMDNEERRMEALLTRLSVRSPRVSKRSVPTNNLGVVTCFDVHIAKQCEWIRAGAEYNIATAVTRVISAVEEQLDDFKHYKVSDILLPLGNDILHFDNNTQTTTSGTHQDGETSLETAHNSAVELYVRLIEQYAQKHNVWLCHVPSNHDRYSGWAVSKEVSAYFAHNSRVHCSSAGMSQQYRKYFVFGNNLIMFNHGEAKEERLMGAVETEARQAVSQTKRTYVYQGHIHHKTRNSRGYDTEKNEKDYSAITVLKAGGLAQNRFHVETIRTPSEADDWHSQNLFLSPTAVEAFIHTEESQKHRLTTWF